MVAPENYSFKEQLNILTNCRCFASTIGSCSHNIIFLQDDADVCLIPRANYLTGYQLALDQVNPQNIRYVDASLSIFVDQQAPWNGPFYYHVSDQLRTYLSTGKSKASTFADFRLYENLSRARNRHIGAPAFYSRIAYEVIDARKRRNRLFQLGRKLKIHE